MTLHDPKRAAPRGLRRPLRAALALAFACAAVAATLPATAADTPPAEPAARTADPLTRARSLVQSQQWSQAISELRRVNASGNADWNNLMGFALRKQARPDLDGAQRHYDAALKIDPAHVGALAYSAELALMKGDLASAEAKAVTLERHCAKPCADLDGLKQSIASFKAGTHKPYK
jgi:Flp pilus assembly protein TadD